MLVTTLMQVFKRQTTVIFFKVYLHHHSAAAGFFNLDQGQHLWTKKKKQTNKVYINIPLPLLLIQYQIPQHCLNPQSKKELSFIYLTSLTNWTEALESKECIHAALLVSPPLVHDKVVAYGRWSSTGKKIHPRRPSCGRFGQEKRKHFRPQYFISRTTFQRLPVTPRRLSCEKVNLHSTLVTWAWNACSTANSRVCR